MNLRKYLWQDSSLAAKSVLTSSSGIYCPSDLIRTARSVEVGNTVVVSILSEEYLSVASIWIRSLRKCGISNFLFVACDKPTCEFLHERDEAFIEANIYYCEGNQSFRSATGFGNKGLSVTAMKYPIVLDLVRAGLGVLLSDIDAIFMKNPKSLFCRNADISFQRVHYFPKEIAAIWGFAACTGFVNFQPTSKTVTLLEKSINFQKIYYSDQLALNLALAEDKILWVDADEINNIRNSLEWSKENFVLNMSRTYFGFGETTGLKIEALPHSLFWRHDWVPLNISSVVICHPNSDKDQSGKILKLKTVGITPL